MNPVGETTVTSSSMYMVQLFASAVLTANVYVPGSRLMVPDGCVDMGVPSSSNCMN